MFRNDSVFALWDGASGWITNQFRDYEYEMISFLVLEF